MTTNVPVARSVSRSWWGATALVLVLGIVLGYGARSVLVEQRQADVANRGTQVMPFDLEHTTHIFEPTDSGGIQRVTADDPNDTEQIVLIRAHLQAETVKFQAGDFSDPAAIHGADMPGLAELRASSDRIQVQYRDLPDGAQITNTTSNATLINALHRWFDAQLADHGGHAAPGMEH